MLAAGGGIGVTVWSMSYKLTFLYAFFSSATFYLAGFIVLWIICRSSYQKDFPPNDGKAEHSKNEEFRAKNPRYLMRPVRDLTRACHQFSQMTAATQWIAPRKAQARLS